jgi:hypothetical protein
MSAGTWSDNISVWSTDGGTSPCGCSPGATPGAVTITVSHPLTVVPNLNFTNSTVTVNASGSLTGLFDLTTGNGTVDIHSTVNLNRSTQNTGAVVTIHNGGTLVASDRIILNGGVLTADAAVITSGRVSISSGATLNVLNGSKLNVLTGNLRNDGTINLDPGSCIETNGNIQNTGSGVINGSGALNSGGNIVNFGTVANTVSWCAIGAGVGMTTPEDCATATGICNAIVLPVELSSFTAEVNEYEEVEIRWTTISEFNSSHFIISKSIDGNNWTELSSTEAAGTTQEEQNYVVYEEVPQQITYYRLTQYDFDGRKNAYDPVSISPKNTASNWTIAPNPASNNNNVTISNLTSGLGLLVITDMRGFQKEHVEFNSVNGQFNYTISNFEKGIYLLTIQQNGISRTERILITE